MKTKMMSFIIITVMLVMTGAVLASAFMVNDSNSSVQVESNEIPAYDVDNGMELNENNNLFGEAVIVWEKNKVNDIAYAGVYNYFGLIPPEFPICYCYGSNTALPDVAIWYIVGALEFDVEDDILGYMWKEKQTYSSDVASSYSYDEIDTALGYGTWGRYFGSTNDGIMVKQSDIESKVQGYMSRAYLAESESNNDLLPWMQSGHGLTGGLVVASSNDGSVANALQLYVPFNTDSVTVYIRGAAADFIVTLHPDMYVPEIERAVMDSAFNSLGVISRGSMDSYGGKYLGYVPLKMPDTIGSGGKPVMTAGIDDGMALGYADPFICNNANGSAAFGVADNPFIYDNANGSAAFGVADVSWWALLTDSAIYLHALMGDYIFSDKVPAYFIRGNLAEAEIKILSTITAPLDGASMFGSVAAGSNDGSAANMLPVFEIGIPVCKPISKAYAESYGFVPSDNQRADLAQSNAYAESFGLEPFGIDVRGLFVNDVLSSMGVGCSLLGDLDGRLPRDQSEQICLGGAWVFDPVGDFFTLQVPFGAFPNGPNTVMDYFTSARIAPDFANLNGMAFGAIPAGHGCSTPLWMPALPAITFTFVWNPVMDDNFCSNDRTAANNEGCGIWVPIDGRMHFDCLSAFYGLLPEIEVNLGFFTDLEGMAFRAIPSVYESAADDQMWFGDYFLVAFDEILGAIGDIRSDFGPLS